MSGSFALLVRNPKVLDFDNKKNYFTQQLHKGRRDHYTPLSLSVRRNSVFEDSFRYFSRKTGPEVKHGKLNVRFNNERVSTQEVYKRVVPGFGKSHVQSRLRALPAMRC